MASSFSVIVPSKNEANLRACVQSIRAAGETCRIIVVDDGLCESDLSVPAVIKALQVFRDLSAAVPIMNVHGEKPFIFARNINIGMRAAGTDDVILLNDDALLETPGGFTVMQASAARNPAIGLISATTNLAGNPEQQQHGPIGMRICPSPTPGNSFATVAFVCVYIPRWTINAVGELDERFGGTTPEGKRIYGHEDNDYCRRLSIAGLKIGICDGCYVDHGSLRSTFRSEPFDMEASRQIYLQKWGKM